MFLTRLLRVLIAVALLGMQLPAHAADDDKRAGMAVPGNTPAKNFYVGARLGYGDNDYPDSNQDGSVTNVRSESNDTTVALTGGYHINENVAVQAGYHDFGESDFAGDSSGGDSWEAGPVSALHESDGWELGVMGRWPIADRWYGLGYIGWLWWESKETYVETSATTVVSESGGDVTYALGLEYDVGQRNKWFYRFMGSHHKVGDFGYDVNGVSAEMVWRFP